MKQTLVTFIADIENSKRPALDELLKSMAKDPEQNSLLPFGQMSSVHYASFSIFQNELGNPLDTLVFEINGDGDLEALIAQIWQQGHSGLEDVLSCCQGYGAKSGDFAQARAFLLKKLQKPAAWHIGNVGLSVTRIRKEQQLRLDIETHLDSLRAKTQLPASQSALYQEILRFVGEKNAWALQKELRLTRREEIEPVWRYRGFIVAFLGILVWGWRVTIPGALLGIGMLRWHEKREGHEKIPRLDPIRQAAQEAAEYGQGQNHLSSLIRVHSSPFRRLLLRAVLFVINLNARTSIHGELGSIPSIHFAHWSLVDGGKRLLFMSNYDNSWGSYLDDFTDKANGGLTSIWSNTRWFPPTRFLIKGGASDGARFKTWARLSQEPVRVWYRAYPTLSVANIERNSAIREGLNQNLQGEALTSWLQLF